MISAERISCAMRGMRNGLVVLAVLGLPLVVSAQTLAHFADGSTITADELRSYVAKRPDLSSAMSNRWAAGAALREMAATAALVREGKKNGVKSPKRGEPSRFDDIYAHRVYRDMAPVCEQPSDEAAAKKYFDAHPDAFLVPPSVRVSRIMLPVDAEVDGQEARDWMLTQAKSIAADRSALEPAVDEADKVYRGDPQGELGWVVLDGEHPILVALGEAAADELVGPVEDDGFVYLYYIQAKREARQLTWEQAANSAAVRALQHCRERAQKDIRARLFAEYGVEFDDAAVSDMLRR